MKKFIIISLLILGACSSQNGNTTEITISVAASMADAIDEIVSSFEEEHNDITVLVNVGGSGSLKQQIFQGAPVDLFLSASQTDMDQLVEEGYIREQFVVPLVSNELVLVTSKSSKQGLTDFTDLTNHSVQTIAIGTPDTVPAGMYAKETLESLDIYPAVEDKLVFAKDVRQVLTYVETGNVAAGIVYLSDAIQSEGVSIVATAEPQWHAPIRYPLGIIEQSKHKDEAKKFYQYLQSDEVLAIFEGYGFIPLVRESK